MSKLSWEEAVKGADISIRILEGVVASEPQAKAKALLDGCLSSMLEQAGVKYEKQAKEAK